MNRLSEFFEKVRLNFPNINKENLNFKPTINFRHFNSKQLTWLIAFAPKEAELCGNAVKSWDILMAFDVWDDFIAEPCKNFEPVPLHGKAGLLGTVGDKTDFVGLYTDGFEVEHHRLTKPGEVWLLPSPFVSFLFEENVTHREDFLALLSRMPNCFVLGARDSIKIANSDEFIKACMIDFINNDEERWQDFTLFLGSTLYKVGLKEIDQFEYIKENKNILADTSAGWVKNETNQD